MNSPMSQEENPTKHQHQQQQLYPYQRLLPDVWSECLSYLPPNELSEASELLPLTKDNSNNNSNNFRDDAEHAAWLSVRSMVEIAEKHWEAASSTRTTSGCNNNNINIDANRLELQKLVAEDTSIVGDLFRNRNKATTNYAACRFRDETWQDLYGFLYSALSEAKSYEYAHQLLSQYTEDDDDDDDDDDSLDSEAQEAGNKSTSIERDESLRFHDPEAIALLMGLVFGINQTISGNHRRKLGSISRACTNIACDSITFRRSHYLKSYSPTEARSYALALRLADEGFWDDASEILRFKIKDLADDTNEEPSLLSVDGMICVSTFLIDRLYSNTYVKNNGQDDEELAIAVRLGRKAVAMAETRYKLYKELLAESAPTTTNVSQPSKMLSLPQAPPPPMESLYANDGLRYIHAKLALGKALSLLAQHIGLLASDPDQMELVHKVAPEGAHENLLIAQNPPLPLPGATPQMIEEEQTKWRQTGHYRGFRKWIVWPKLFFEESRRHLQEGLEACALLQSTNLALMGALESAQGERSYCASSACTRHSWRHTMIYHLSDSIASFSATFQKITKELLRHVALAKENDSLQEEKVRHDNSSSHVNSALDLLLRCGKDFGKTCSFANHFRVDYRDYVGNSDSNTDGGLAMNPELVFDFVYLVSIHRHGSFHPTTENVIRLAGSEQQRSGNTPTPIAEKYRNVVTWLVEAFGSDFSSTTNQ